MRRDRRDTGVGDSIGMGHGRLPRHRRIRPVFSVLVAATMCAPLLLSVTTETTAASAATPALALPTLKEGGSFTAFETGTEDGSWPGGLDPGTSDTPAANMDEENAVFGSLFELAGKNGTLVPDLATGYKILDGGKTVDVFVRHGVEFSDGTPFNAAAVVFNWRRDFRLKDNDLPSWPITTTDPFTTDGPYTAVIHFSKAYTPVITSFHIHDVNWIVSPTALAKMGEAKFRITPVGAGPFTVVSDTVSSELVLKKNPHYWQKGLPYLDNLTFKSTASDETALEAMQAGQGQAYIGMSTLELEKSFASSYTVTSEETADPRDVQFNTTKAPFNNKLAREAVYYATDAAVLDKQLDDDITPVVQGFTGPGGLFYEPTVPGYREYDLAKAKALVKQLGGLSFTLLGTDMADVKTLDEALQTMWQAAGMKVNLNLVADLQADIQQFQANSWQTSAGADGSYDPAGGVGVWFWFLSTSPYSGVHDPKMNALIDKATEVPESQRGAVYQQAAEYISNNAYAVQLFPEYVFNIADKDVYGPCLTTVCPTIETVPEVWWQNVGYTK
jgi:peptide/nickel transport system substrate-binding protein